jgi:ABC-type Na+ efflux pump permease subunit
VRFAFIGGIKDLRRRLADPAALLLWVGFPIVLGALMSMIGGGGAMPKALVLLVDQDQTFMSGLLARAGSQSQVSQFLDIQSVTEAEGRRRIDDGDGTALLIIPKGFQDGVLREQPTELTLVKNPAYTILPGIVEEGLRMMVEATFYAQRLFNEPLRQMLDAAPAGARTGPADDVVAAISRAINQRMRALEKTLLPPLFTVEATAKVEEANQPNFGALFLPGLLFMALMFTAQGMSMDLWTEKLKGTLHRTISAPQHIASFLAGKLLASVAIMSAATLAALAVGIFGFDVTARRAALALVWAAYAGGALFCYLAALQLFSTSARGGQLLLTLVVFPLIMIGGSFFPFEAMPPWMANIGRWTPNGLAVIQIKEILFGAPDVQAMVLAALGIGVPAVLAFFVATRRLTGAFAAS